MLVPSEIMSKKSVRNILFSSRILVELVRESRFSMLILLSFLLIGFSAIGQNVISGVVSDNAGDKLEWVGVSILAPVDSSMITYDVTDSLGRFELVDFAELPVLLKTSLIGYETNYQLVRKYGNVPIVLKQSSINLQDVEVIGYKSKISMNKGVLTFSVGEEHAGQTGHELMQKVPTISVDKDGNLQLKNNRFAVLINGKETHLSGSELNMYLQSLGAGEIEKIEVNGMPGAKYSAEGGGGIVNIKLKKQPLGYYAGVTGRFGYGEFPKLEGRAFYKLRRKKTGFSVSMGSAYNESINRNRSLKDNLTPNYESTFTDSSEWLPVTKSYNVRATINHNFNESHVLSGFASVGGSFENNGSLNGSKSSGVINSVQRLKETVGSDQYNANYGLDYRWDFGGYKSQFLNIELSGNNSLTNKSLEQNITFQSDQENHDVKIGHKQDYSYSLGNARINYSLSVHDSLQLVAGVGCNSSRINSSLVYDLDSAASDFLIVPVYSNEFAYNEEVYSAYALLSGDYNQWSYRVGLRSETSVLSSQVKAGEFGDSTMTRTFTNLFPDLGLYWQYSDYGNIGVTYNRRLNRPIYSDMNPVVRLRNRFAYVRGNSNLNSSYQNKVELTYKYKNHNFSLGTTQSKGDISEVPFQNDTLSVSFSTKINISRSAFYELNYSSYYSFGKRLQGQIYAFLSQDYTWSSNEGVSVNQSMVTYGLYPSLSFRISESVKLDLGYNYTGPAIQGVSVLKVRHYMTGGISYFKNNLSINLNVTDPFRTNQWNSVTNNANMKSSWLNRWETGIVYLGLRYVFGNREKGNKTNYNGDSDVKNSGRI